MGKFKCYRGAYFSDRQLRELFNNIGSHIETLGFLSTSLDRDVVNLFLLNGNTVIEIDVDADSLKDENLDLGYALLGELS